MAAASFCLPVSISREDISRNLMQIDKLDDQYDSNDSINLDHVSDSDQRDLSISLDESLEEISSSEIGSTGSLMDMSDIGSNKIVAKDQTIWMDKFDKSNFTKFPKFDPEIDAHKCQNCVSPLGKSSTG